MSNLVPLREDMHRQDRRYLDYTLAGIPPAATMAGSLDHGATWVAMSRDGDTFSLLVAGPEATSNPADTAVGALGRNDVWLRLTSSPEIITEDDAGTVTIE